MKRLIIASLLLCTVAALAAVAGPDASRADKEKSPFAGNWGATDFDDSLMQMKISNGLSVRLLDDLASLCPEGGPATAMGKGMLLDDVTLEVPWRIIRCAADNTRLEGVSVFEYVPEEDILLSWHEDFEIVWERS
jgi:hypothetical protein